MSEARPDIEAAAASLAAVGPRVVVKDGADGAVSVDRSGHVLREVGAPVVTLDTTGAGDTFLAVMLASSLLRQSSLAAIDLQRAALASSITIGRTGTLSAFPKQFELAQMLK